MRCRWSQCMARPSEERGRGPAAELASIRSQRPRNGATLSLNSGQADSRLGLQCSTPGALAPCPQALAACTSRLGTPGSCPAPPAVQCRVVVSRVPRTHMLRSPLRFILP